MPIVDDHGRVAGRVNLIDALVAVFLLVLIPVAYGAYLLFRTPVATITGVNPPTVYQGPAQRVAIAGRNLRPFMRVSFGTTQGKTFLIGSTESAAVDLPDLAPGTYDVVLFDYMQEVGRLKNALTVLPMSPQPVVEMEVAGWFFHGSGPAVVAGEKFPPTGDPIAEVLSVGAAVPADMRVKAGDVTLSIPLEGRTRIPATLRVKCSVTPGSDGTARCSVPGPAGAAVIGPDATLTLQGPKGWIDYQISEAYATTTPQLATVHAVFVVTPSMAAKIKPGDNDTSPGANVPGYRAKIVSVDGVTTAGLTNAQIGSASALPGARLLASTLSVPVQQRASGWTYKQQPLKIGAPLTFETPEYIVHGEVTDMTLPRIAAGPLGTSK